MVTSSLLASLVSLVSACLAIQLNGSCLMGLAGQQIRCYSFSAFQGCRLPAEVSHELPSSVVVQYDDYLRNLDAVALVSSGLSQFTYTTKSLELVNNVIEFVLWNAFERFPNLDTLSLRNNRLQKIEVGVFSSLSNLTHLDVSGNFLSQFDFRYLDTLTYLNASHNLITAIANLQIYPDQAFDYDFESNLLSSVDFCLQMSQEERGGILRLAHNPITCSCSYRPLLPYLESGSTCDSQHADKQALQQLVAVVHSCEDDDWKAESCHTGSRRKRSAAKFNFFAYLSPKYIVIIVVCLTVAILFCIAACCLWKRQKAEAQMKAEAANKVESELDHPKRSSLPYPQNHSPQQYSNPEFKDDKYKNKSMRLEQTTNYKKESSKDRAELMRRSDPTNKKVDWMKQSDSSNKRAEMSRQSNLSKDKAEMMKRSNPTKQNSTKSYLEVEEFV